MTAAASVTTGIIRAKSGSAVRAKEVFLRRSVASGMMTEVAAAKHSSLVEDRRDGESPLLPTVEWIGVICSVAVLYLISCDLVFLGNFVSCSSQRLNGVGGLPS